jgi:hypothetical protein
LGKCTHSRGLVEGKGQPWPRSIAGGGDGRRIKNDAANARYGEREKKKTMVNIEY